jgi:hypothetical protein
MSKSMAPDFFVGPSCLGRALLHLGRLPLDEQKDAATVGTEPERKLLVSFVTIIHAACRSVL